MDLKIRRYLFVLFFITLAPTLFAAENIPGSDIEKLTRMDGSSFKTDKNKLLLYFWATWCPDCKEKLHGDLKYLKVPERAELVTVNTDKDAERALHYISKESVQLPVTRDNDKTVAKALKVFSVPFWAVLERETDGSWKVKDSESGGNLAKMKSALGAM